MKFAQIVMGPAGSGKSTFCKMMQEHGAATHRSIRVANMDPAAEEFKYKLDFDVRDLVSVADVMEELDFGPNGGLVYAMEFLTKNMDWLEEELERYGDDDYLILDCPGQIELYTHIPVMPAIVALLQREGFNVCGVYLLDAMFVSDASKLLSGTLMALSAMMHLELPHVNVLSKCDLVDVASIERFLMPSGKVLAEELDDSTDERFKRLNAAFGTLVDDYSLVKFIPLDVSDEDSIGLVMAHIDHAIQYGEDIEPHEPHDEAVDDD